MTGSAVEFPDVTNEPTAPIITSSALMMEKVKGKAIPLQGCTGRSPAEIVGSNPTGGMDICVCCECRVLSGRGLCDELITRPEESYRLCCVVVCDLETSRTRRS